MANDKWGGYTPKKEEFPTKLDGVNPFEFRRGMDLELTNLGVSRLAESTPEEREKCTETVLKNLEGNDGYYTSLVTYETTYRNIAKGEKKPSFKTWLAEQEDSKMKEVGKKGAEFKNDKMKELKEAIKAEVKAILSESNSVDDTTRVKDREDKRKSMRDFAKNDKDFDGPSDDDTDIKASKGAKGKEKALKALKKETEKLKKDKDKNKDKLSVPLQKYKDGKLTADEYKKLSAELVKANKEINARLTAIEKEEDEITLSEKLGRREVAKTMMEKDTHMEILNIIKEAGVNLREGAGGIKMYYEIAKTAYQEGFMAGLKK